MNTQTTTIEPSEADAHLVNDLIDAECRQTTALAVRPASTVATALPPEQINRLPASAAQRRTEQVGDLLASAYSKASTLQMTKEEQDKLTARFPDEDVEVRPHDGLIFIPHIKISKRLHQVFGPGQTTMIRRREWVEGNRIYGEWAMLIRGVFIGETVGAMDYHPSNPKMNYADALEGTRGEAIRRIAGKELDCGDQVWDPEYSRQWVAKFAAKVNGKWERRGFNAPPSNGNGPRTAPNPQNHSADTNGHNGAQTPNGSAGSAKNTATTTAAPAIKPHAEWLSDCKAAFLREVSGDAATAALEYMVEQGMILDTEEVKDVTPEKLFSAADQTKPRQENAALVKAQYQAHMKAILAKVPGASEPEHKIPDDALSLTGTVEHVSEKSGNKQNGEKWTNYGVKLNGGWYNTFSNRVGENAKALKSKRATIWYTEGEKGNNLVEIKEAV